MRPDAFAFCILMWAQTSLSLALAFVFSRLYWGQRSQYQKLWSGLWLGFALSRSALALGFSAGPPPRILSEHLLLTLLDQLGSSVALACLFGVTRVLTLGRDLSHRGLAWLAAAVLLAGLGGTAFSALGDRQAYQLQQALRSGLGGLLCLAMGGQLFLAQRREDGMAPRLTASAVILFGLPLGAYAVATAAGVGFDPERSMNGVVAAASFELALLAVAGCGASAWFVDREREKSRASARSEQRLLGELADQERRFQAVVERVQDSIQIVDPEGRILSNARLHPAFGYREADLVGHSGLDFIHPEDREGWLRLLTQVASAPGAVGSAEVRIRSRDGDWRPVELTATNCRDVPALDGILVVGHDLTEHRRLERRLAQSERLEGLGRLAGGVAHNFNNLLTIVGGNAELLRSELAADSPAQELLAEVDQAAAHGAALTRQLLAFARQEPVEPRVIDLNQQLQRLAPLLKRLLGDDIELELRLDPEAVPVRIDPSQAEQLVLNLAINARDAMAGGGKLSLATGIEASSDASGRRRALLVVSDTGDGMSPEVQERAFEPFFTTKRLAGGTGLGLATVHGSVHQAGGEVDLASAPGCGTRVAIRLPLAETPWPSQPPMARPPA